MNGGSSYGDEKALEGSEESQMNNFPSFGWPKFDTTKEQRESSVTDRKHDIVNINCRAPVDSLLHKPDCQWQLSRKQLTPKYMMDLALNCPLAIKANYLLCIKTDVIMLLEDAQKECQADPWEYEIIGEAERESNKDPRSPKYRGDIKLIVTCVPKCAGDRRIEVSTSDLTEWIIHGMKEEDPRIKAISLQITKTEKCIKTLTNQLVELEGVNKMEGILAEPGENVPQSADQQEADVTKRLKKEEEINLEKYRKEIEVASEVYQHVKITFKQHAIFEESRNLFVTFSPREKNGTVFEDVVIGKKDWPGLKLSVPHDDHPIWLGRGSVPNGKNPLDVTDYRAYQANMHKVEFFQRRHGFGCEVQIEASQYAKSNKRTMDIASQVKGSSPSEYSSSTDEQQYNTSLGKQHTEEKNKALLGNETMLYRGHYKEGIWHGFGILYSKIGFYGGQFRAGSPYGQGTLHRGNGDLIQGEWGVVSRFEDPEASSNPYLTSLGTVHGKVDIIFSDGARYTGMMEGGRIVGKGRYENQRGGLLEGVFVDGELSGHNCMSVSETGELVEGEWQCGILHGKGRFGSPEEGEIKGFWHYGVMIGYGYQKFPCGARFKGFWLDGDPTGIGTLWHGNVKEVMPASSNCNDMYISRQTKTSVLANKVYEGNWRAGKLKIGAVLTLRRKDKQKQLLASGEGRWGRPIIRVMRHAETAARSSVINRRRISILDRSYRGRVCKRNCKALQRCLNRMSGAILHDAAESLQPGDMRKELKRRNLAINHLSGLSSKKLVHFHAQALEEELMTTARPGREGEVHMHSVLYCMIQSFFEELEEEHQLLSSRLDILAETDVKTKMSESTTSIKLAAPVRVQ